MEFELTAEQRALKEVVHDFVAREVRSRARHTDEASEFNWEATRKMGPLGLLGLEVPEEYGGAALDAISVAIVIEELGWGCGSTALAIAAHNGLGLGPIVAYGTEEQKRRWLPHLTSGKGKLACLSLTEPGGRVGPQGRRPYPCCPGGRLVDHRRGENVDDQRLDI